MTYTTLPRPPRNFVPPIVKSSEQGVHAFRAYDWYFRFMKRHLAGTKRVFLVPCAATKPVCRSPSHRGIHQTFATVYDRGRTILVVSEPVALIRYSDLSTIEPAFHYEFPPALLGDEARALFVKRLSVLLAGKDIAGCLPSHHAGLVKMAAGSGWMNYWSGGLCHMRGVASQLRRYHKLPLLPL